MESWDTTNKVYDPLTWAINLKWSKILPVVYVDLLRKSPVKLRVLCTMYVIFCTTEYKHNFYYRETFYIRYDR